jgi:NADPH:quinone reductase-like Zn-dependent oxidoreductase
MKQWSIQGYKSDFDGLKYEDAEIPKVGESEVLVKLYGASLNYRDLIIPKVNRPIKGPSTVHARELTAWHLLGNIPIPARKFPSCGGI